MPRLHHLPGSCCFLCGLSSKQTKHDGGREVFTARLTQRRNWNFTQPHCRGNWITLLVAGLEECITNALRWRAEWRRGRRREQLGRVRLHPLTPPPPKPSDRHFLSLLGLSSRWSDHGFPSSLPSQCQAAAWLTARRHTRVEPHKAIKTSI